MLRTSKTEFQVVAHVAAGYETKEIAAKFFRSYHTIVEHLKNVRLKNGLRNIADVTREFVLAHGDPKKYLQLILVWIQLSMAFASYDVEVRNMTRARRGTRTQRQGRKNRDNNLSDFIYG